MRPNTFNLAGFSFVALFAVACGGKLDGTTGQAASDQQAASSTSSGASSGEATCRPAPVTAGGGGVAGGACVEMYESAVCGATTYTVSCTCPNACTCVVNGETVDTAPTASCSKELCPPPDDAWKTCGFPTVPGMP